MAKQDKAAQVDAGTGPNVSQGEAPAEHSQSFDANAEGFERTTTGLPVTPAGEQFGETPGPIPALNSRPRAPQPEEEALPRSDAAFIQGAPPAAPAAGPGTPGIVGQVRTAAAPNTAAVDSFGLSALARRVYGDTKYAADIFDANRDILVSPDSVIVGTVVRLPEVKK